MKSPHPQRRGRVLLVGNVASRIGRIPVTYSDIVIADLLFRFELRPFGDGIRMIYQKKIYGTAANVCKMENISTRQLWSVVGWRMNRELIYQSLRA
jgi:ribosome modulation factor